MPNPDFTNPQEVLNILCSENIDYSELQNIAESLLEQIPELHINQDGRKFQAITQVILECLKQIRGFSSNEWISETKLRHELKPNERIIEFTRINAKQELCLYKIANFDQIDFEKELESADEFEIVPKKPKNLNPNKKG